MVSSCISWFSYVVTTPERKQPKSGEVYLGSWSEGIQTTIMRKSWHRDKWVLGGGGQVAAACSVLSRNRKREQGKLVQVLQFLVFCSIWDSSTLYGTFLIHEYAQVKLSGNALTGIPKGVSPR